MVPSQSSAISTSPRCVSLAWACSPTTIFCKTTLLKFVSSGAMIPDKSPLCPGYSPTLVASVVPLPPHAIEIRRPLAMLARISWIPETTSIALGLAASSSSVKETMFSHGSRENPESRNSPSYNTLSIHIDAHFSYKFPPIYMHPSFFWYCFRNMESTFCIYFLLFVNVPNQGSFIHFVQRRNAVSICFLIQ